jgi:hypothetical protein
MTANWQWAELVAAAFDAGRPIAPLTRVDGGISHAVFQLQTTTGRYAAKRLNVVAERWWWDAYHAAARIEQAAAADGVRLPERLPPRVVVLDLDGVRHHWQLHRWRAGLPFERTIAAYRRAGGRPIPADPALFHGIVEAQMHTAEWLLWRALGHRGDDPAGQARAATECLARLRGAAKSLHRIPEWTGWLTALQ